MSKLNGIFAVTVTHFDADGSINYDACEKHLNWLLESGVHGILPVGATGEFSALSMSERKQYVEFVMKIVGGRVPVCVGAVALKVTDVLELIAHAHEFGASAVMCLPPALHLSQNEIYQFYKTLSEHAQIPVMVYNNPGSAGFDIEPQTLERIVELPMMDYIKESTGEMQRLTRVVDELDGKIIPFCGCETLAMESFIMGAQGWVCVAANFAPKMCVQIYELSKAGKLDEARSIYQKLLPFLRLLEDTGELWQVAKYLAHKQGYCSGVLRLPRLPISEAVKSDTDALFAAVKLA